MTIKLAAGGIKGLRRSEKPLGVHVGVRITRLEYRNGTSSTDPDLGELQPLSQNLPGYWNPLWSAAHRRERVLGGGGGTVFALSVS